ncbi:hypothetical protein [Ktedonospora formicarum]|nr:hypothetical protein [Ktedonospora formicarum]
MHEKLDAYAATGSPEYWIVTLDAHIVEMLVLDRDFYRPQFFYCR